MNRGFLDPSNKAISIDKGKVGIGTDFPSALLTVSSPSQSATQNDNNGILLTNPTLSSPATQYVSPPIIWQSYGTTTSGISNQDTRWRADAIATSGVAAPTTKWSLGSSINNGAYTAQFTVDSGGVVTATTSLASNGVGAGTQLQSIGAAAYALATIKTTNGGSTINSALITGAFGTSSGTFRLSYDATNQLTLCAGNASSVSIARAGLQIGNLTNTAGSEAGDLVFLTQSGGAAITERWRIGANGTLTNLLTTPAGSAHIELKKASTSVGLFNIQTGSAVLSTPGQGAIDSDDTFLYFTNNTDRYRQNFLLGQNKYVTADVTSSTTTLAAVTDLTSGKLTAGKKFKFEAVLFTRSTTGEGVKVRMNTTTTLTATNIVYQVEIPDTSTYVSVVDLGTSSVGSTTSVTSKVNITGTIEVNVAGTLTIEFAQNAHVSSSSTLMRGSYLLIEQIS